MASRDPAKIYPYEPPQNRSFASSLIHLPGRYLKVLTMPTPRTFAREGERASWGMVWIQLLFLMLIPAILGFIKIAYRQPELKEMARSKVLYDILASFSIGTSVAATVLQVLLAPIIFFIALTLQFLLAKIMRGYGHYLPQGYSMLLYQVPLVLLNSIVSALLVIFGIVNFRFLGPPISIVLFLYGVWLNVTMLSGVHTIIRSKAAVIVLLYYLLCAILILGLLLSAGYLIINSIYRLNTQP